MNGSLERKVTVGFGLALVLLLAVTAAAAWNAQRFEATFRWVNHTHDVLNRLDAVLADALSLQTGARGFALTGRDEFLPPFDAASAHLEATLRNLRRLTSDNPAQQAQLDRLDTLSGQLRQMLLEDIAARRERGSIAANEAAPYLAGQDVVAAFRRTVRQMIAREQQLLDERLARARTAIRLTGGAIVVAFVVAPSVVIAGLFVLRRDLRLRQRAEASLQRERYLLNELMTNASEIIYFKDRESRFQRISRELARRFRLKDPAEAIGRTDFDFYAEEHARQTFENERAIVESGVPFHREEKETWPDGRVTWVMTTKLPLRDAEGRIVGTFGISRDITERKRNEEHIQQLNVELQQHAQEVEAANRELESFSYSVSHDLRAPLRHIDGFVALLIRRSGEKLDAESRRYLTVISRAAKQMGALIDDLLAFSRIGRAPLRRERFSHQALVRELIAERHYDIPELSIAWQIDELPDVPADPAMLRLVWSNLLDNAVKYSSKANPPRIVVGASRTAELAETTYFVRDNGVGFDMAYADKLFGVFQRLHDPDEFEGTGIGLANVRRVVARHGGRTWAEGRVGAGATFYFTLPENVSARAASI